MISIKIEGLDALQKSLDKLAKSQIPSVLRNSINTTLAQSRKDLQQEMPRVFDRPTPYALGGISVTEAKKEKLVGYIGLKDDPAKGIPASKFLRPQVLGGGRGLKRAEKALQRVGILPPGWWTVPGTGARFDTYGNMSRGQIVELLAYLKAFGEEGCKANMTDKSRPAFERRLGKRAAGAKVQFFVGGLSSNRSKHLAPGIYQRFGFGHGSAVKPVLMFVKQPSYRPRFHFYDVVTRTFERDFSRNFQEEFIKKLGATR